MKLKQKRKYGDKDSCHNIEVTIPLRKSGYGRHCHNLLRQDKGF